MLAYIARRLGVTVVILFGSSYLLYNLAAISGDPLEALRTSREPNVQQQIRNLTRDLNLDVPPPLRYFIWLRGILGVFSGDIDFGKARTGQDVGELIWLAIPTTIRLVLGATILAIVLGITIGIITALRQYSRFDYSMTFVSFLLFSLPIFWVAVLLKEYLAIQFNNFLGDPVIAPNWLIGMSIFSGIFWSAVISGDRRRVFTIFGVVSVSTAVLLQILSATRWFANPGLGPIVLFLLSVGVAFGITHLSVGISNKVALRASLTMAVLTLVLYYPNQWLFDVQNKKLVYTLMIITLFVVSAAVPYFMTRIDRGPIIRTSMIAAFLMGLLLSLIHI